jgi:glycosyltransferase involved in cell wall biosynthesis
MVLLVNQHTVPIFVDIVNAFATSGERTILFTGHIELGGVPLSKDVRIIKSVAYNRRSAITRLTTWLFFSLHYFLHLLFTSRPNKILVVTNPPFAPFVTAWVSRLRKFSFSILLYDLYPEAVSQAGLMSGDHWIVRRWKKMNPSLFEAAKKVFTLSESMKNAALPYIASPQKIRVIHNWADTNYIHPIPRSKNPFVMEHGLTDKFVVLYAGNMGLTHDLESLVDAASIISQQRNDIIFLLVGDGGKRTLLEKYSAEKGISSVKFLPFQDTQMFPMVMASADIGVVTLGEGAEGISVPSKTYINLAAGVAILTIAPANSELNRIVVEHQVGIVCEPNHPEQVASAIIRLKENRILLDGYKQKSLDAAQKFTPANAVSYVHEMNTK